MFGYIGSFKGKRIANSFAINEELEAKRRKNIDLLKKKLKHNAINDISCVSTKTKHDVPLQSLKNTNFAVGSKPEISSGSNVKTKRFEKKYLNDGIENTSEEMMEVKPGGSMPTLEQILESMDKATTGRDKESNSGNRNKSKSINANVAAKALQDKVISKSTKNKTDNRKSSSKDNSKSTSASDVAKDLHVEMSSKNTNNETDYQPERSMPDLELLSRPLVKESFCKDGVTKSPDHETNSSHSSSSKYSQHEIPDKTNDNNAALCKTANNLASKTRKRAAQRMETVEEQMPAKKMRLAQEVPNMSSKRDKSSDNLKSTQNAQGRNFCHFKTSAQTVPRQEAVRGKAPVRKQVQKEKVEAGESSMAKTQKKSYMDKRLEILNRVEKENNNNKDSQSLKGNYMTGRRNKSKELSKNNRIVLI